MENFHQQGICPHCYSHILDLYDDSVEDKWYAILIRNGNIYLKFRLFDLIKDYEDEKDIGSITCHLEVPPEIPDNYGWVCKKCYDTMTEDRKSNNDKDDKDESWIDDLNDWR